MPGTRHSHVTRHLPCHKTANLASLQSRQTNQHLKNKKIKKQTIKNITHHQYNNIINQDKKIK